jgi:hypothetical protein
MCAGDSTIESPIFEKGEAGNIVSQRVDGHGVTHKCKNTDHLWSIATGSESKAFESWDWQLGDTVESVFGRA